MRNVHLHAADGIVLDVRRLRGTMISRIAGRPPVFDDGGSYVLHLDEGELSIDMGSLERLLNQRVFAYQGAPLEEIRIRATDDGRLEQKAKLHKGITVPVSMKSSVAATPDGQLRLHVESMKAAGIPAGGLLKLFGLEVDDLVKLEQRRGVVIRDNDIVIGLGQVLPPPEIRGHLTAVVRPRQRPRSSVRHRRAALAGAAGATGWRGTELRLLPWRQYPLRKAHDDRRGPAADRCGSQRSIRLLPGALQGPARGGLFEEYGVWWSQDLHAGFQQPHARSRKGPAAATLTGQSGDSQREPQISARV